MLYSKESSSGPKLTGWFLVYGPSSSLAVHGEGEDALAVPGERLLALVLRQVGDGAGVEDVLPRHGPDEFPASAQSTSRYAELASCVASLGVHLCMAINTVKLPRLTTHKTNSKRHCQTDCRHSIAAANTRTGLYYKMRRHNNGNSEEQRDSPKS